MRLIDGDELLYKLCMMGHRDDITSFSIRDIMKTIDTMLTADATPVVHGQWEYYCGAKMGGEVGSMTNGDYIRNMSNKELADFICDIYACKDCYYMIRVNDEWMEPDEVRGWLENRNATD
jgi:hypothetical protein